MYLLRISLNGILKLNEVWPLEGAMYISLWENSRGHPDNVSFMQFSTKIDGFEQKDSQGFENSYSSYEQYPLENFFIFTIYQNYTLALNIKYLELTKMDLTRFAMKLFRYFYIKLFTMSAWFNLQAASFTIIPCSHDVPPPGANPRAGAAPPFFMMCDRTENACSKSWGCPAFCAPPNSSVSLREP